MSSRTYSSSHGTQQHLCILKMFRMLKTFLCAKVFRFWSPEREATLPSYD